MFETIINFLINVPVESSIIRSLIMVAEILLAGVILYYLWEMVPHLSRGIVKASRNLATTGIVHATVRGKRRKKATKTISKEKTFSNVPASDFKDLYTDLVP